MSSELKKRIFTAVLGAAALLALILFGGWLGVFFLSAIITLGMVYEFTDMVFTLPDRVEKRYVLLSLAWFVNLVCLYLRQGELHLLIFVFLGLFTYFLLSARRYSDVATHEISIQFATHFKELMYSVFGVVYVILLPLYFSRIHESTHGPSWLVLFFLMVWAGDSGAYFVGKRWGKNRLYPCISPKKTKEGAIGGLLAGMVVAILSKLTFFWEMSWIAVAIVPVLIAVVSQAGDLCESFFKRAFQRKDSSSLLPGHGGFLDRFDGVVFSLPVMYACVRLFG